MISLPTAVIESLPVRVPTDFIVGSAGLGSIVAFAVGLVLRVRLRGQARIETDPLQVAGYGAGLSGLIAALIWLLSLAVEVLFD